MGLCVVFSVFFGGLRVNFLVGFVGGTWVEFRVVLWKYCAIILNDFSKVVT